MSFKAKVPVLIFCLDDLAIDVSGVLESHTIIVMLPILPLGLLIFALYTNWGTSSLTVVHR